MSQRMDDSFLGTVYTGTTFPPTIKAVLYHDITPKEKARHVLSLAAYMRGFDHCVYDVWWHVPMFSFPINAIDEQEFIAHLDKWLPGYNLEYTLTFTYVLGSFECVANVRFSDDR